MTEERGERLDILGILDLLPHRYPFVMVDRILDYEPGKCITGLKNVTMNEPHFQGHFPARPVMPGVLLIEGMAQTGGILAYLDSPAESRGKLVYFVGIDRARFRRTVVPGDQVIFRLELLKKRRSMVKMAGQALVDGQAAVEAELMATFG